MSNLQKIKSSSFFNILFQTSSALFLMLFTMQHSLATPGTFTSYIGIDPVNHTTYAYDENFNPYPVNPVDPSASIIELPHNKPFWYLGHSFDVIRVNSNNSIDVVSDNPAYSELIHHMVMIYNAPKRHLENNDGFTVPFGTGSELTSFHFPKGYGYKLDSGYLIPNAHWQNPSKIAFTYNLFLRVTILVDDEPNAYHDTNISEIDVVDTTSEFSIPPGKSKKISPKFIVKTKRRIVAVIPHIHDHAETIKLKTTQGTIHKFKTKNQNIPVTHDDMGQGPTPLHSHQDHLPVNGLTPWTPGKYGPTLNVGDFITIESEFNNPHPRNIENMIIGTIFWENID